MAAIICYFHEAWVVAKNSLIELRCLLDDIVPFYLGFTVYTTIYLAHSRHPSPWNNLWLNFVNVMAAFVGNANSWTDLGN